jgi:hypothetical protein
MNKIKSLIIILLLVNYSFAQKNQKFFGPLKPYSEFIKSDSTCLASFISFKFQYLYQFSNGFYKIGGTHSDLGINLARFFTKKIILGVGFEYKFIPFRGKQKLASGFIDNFNANYIPVLSDKYDSIRSLTLHGAINNINGYKSGGSTFSSFSINFSPFPDRFGGILLQFKMGYLSVPIYGPLSDIYEENTNIPTLNFAVRKNFVVELSFCPYKFFKSHRLKIVGGSIKDWYKFLIISFYANYFSLQNATVGGEKLSKFTGEAFTDNYKSLHNFGIKFGVGIW